MKAFLVELENRPGEMARIAEAIAEKRVNITGVAGAVCEESGRVALMADNEAMARSALEEADCSFEERDVSQATLRNQPGSLAMVTRRLADAGVNIEAFMATGMSGSDVMVAIVTDNATKANEVLSSAGSTTR